MVWRDPRIADRGDVRVLAACFAEALALGDLEEAERVAGLAFALAERGGWVFFRTAQYDRHGRLLCKVLGRHGWRCWQPAGDDGLCGTHRRYLAAGRAA